MSTKTGYLKEYTSQDTIIPKTSTAAVYDPAKEQALSATLINTPSKDTLGYPSFSTVTAYSEGDIVYYANKLYKCKAGGHAAGAWADADFEETDIKTEIAIATDADDTPTENSTKLVKSGGVKNAIDTAVEAVEEQANEQYAKKDGYYSQMTVGSAENLVGQTVDEDAYLIRPTAGAENEVANGVASVLGMEGNSCVWNQLVQNGDFSSGTTNWKAESGVTISANNGILSITKTSGNNGAYQLLNILSGHKYYVRVSAYCENSTYIRITAPSGQIQGNYSIAAQTWTYIKYVSLCTTSGDRIYIYENNATSHTLQATKINIIDLTLLGIDNLTTTDQVEAWLAQHVGTKPYYAYNAGTILSAQTLGIKTYGQNLLNPTTKQAKLIPYEWEENSNVYTIKNVPSGATATFTPDNTGVAETVDISGGSLDITSYGSGILELSSATADTYVCMKWDEQKDNDVVPYEDPHTYDFDVKKVYGKVNGDGEYVQCFPDGMRRVDTYIDTLTVEKAIVRTKKIDLGNFNYTKYTNPSNIPFFRSTLTNSRRVSDDVHNFLTSKYYESKTISGGGSITQEGYYLTINQSYSATNAINISDKDYNSLNEAGFKTAVTGIKLVYQLATPITYTDLIYRDNGVDRPLADVLMNIEVNNWSMEEQLMTPYDNGNPTSIPATISTKYGMDAVEQIDTLNKTCYFADDVKANLQALLTCINTNCAETLGGTFSIGDPTQEDSKVFTFTFTPNTEPDVEPNNE